MKPRRWQQDALRLWVGNRRRGIVSVVTGGGKSTFAMHCIQEMATHEPSISVIILVPTVALLDQWYVALQEDLGVNAEEIACFSGHEKAERYRRINLVVLNTARALGQRLSPPSPSFLIVDECHRAGSPENAKALQGHFAATLGLSATPMREHDEGFETHLVPALGEIIFEYGYREAMADSVICPFRLVHVRVALLADEAEEYRRLTRVATRAFRAIEKHGGDGKSVNIILQRRARVVTSATMRIPVAAKILEEHLGARAILFHERVDAANKLLGILRERNHRPTVYHSKLAPFTRRDNLRLFRRGAFDVLVTCRALDEGLNVPDTMVAVIASSTASARQRIQRLGRVLRPAPGKDAATIYTIYASDAEGRRLAAEQHRLEGISSVDWRDAVAR